MDTLDLILARTNLAKTVQKLQNSLDETRQKNPEPTGRVADIVKSMTESIEEVTFSYVTFCELELEYRAARQRANDLEYSKFGDMEKLKEIVKQNDILKAQNERLKEEF